MQNLSGNFKKRKRWIAVFILVLLVVIADQFVLTRHTKPVKSSPELIEGKQGYRIPALPPKEVKVPVTVSESVRQIRHHTVALKHMIKSGYQVNEPIPSLVEEPVITFVETVVGDTIKYSTGTTVIIPPNAFIDKDGKEVEGQVAVAYKEYNSAYDIFISGIPMNYDSAGKVFQFESAGMMQLTASLNNEAVFLAKNKKIKVSLTSSANDEDFSLYYFDPQTGQWINKGVSTVSKNSNSREGGTSFASFTPPQVIDGFEPALRPNFKFYCTEFTRTQKMPGPGKLKKPGNFIFWFDDITFKQYPELKPFRSTSWICEDINSKFVYKILFRKGYSRKNNESIAGYWDGISIAHIPGEDEFTFYFSTEYDTLIVPVYARYGNKKITYGASSKRILRRTEKRYHEYDSLAQIFYRSEATRYRRYQQDSVAIIAAGGWITPAAISGAIVRSFEADGFGIWNCDRLIKEKDVVTVLARFTDSEENILPLGNVYLVQKGINSVITYSITGLTYVRFNSKSRNILWGILPDSSLAYLTPSDFKSVNKDTGEHVFKMNIIPNAKEGMQALRREYNL